MEEQITWTWVWIDIGIIFIISILAFLIKNKALMSNLLKSITLFLLLNIGVCLVFFPFAIAANYERYILTKLFFLLLINSITISAIGFIPLFIIVSVITFLFDKLIEKWERKEKENLS